MRPALTMTTACATHLAASAQVPEGLVEVSGWMVSDQRDADDRYVTCTAFSCSRMGSLSALHVTGAKRMFSPWKGQKPG